jgi:hypothetical protein
MASIKNACSSATYAQNLCCGAARTPMWATARYQSHSACKSLIHIASLNCFFSGQSKESLDLQGLRVIRDKLSTKLSTENLEICKVLLNQALRAFFACIFEASPVTSHGAVAGT